MRHERGGLGLRLTLAAAVSAALLGCQTTTPGITTGTLGPNDLACRAAPPSNGTNARVRIAKGDASELTGIGLTEVCSTLEQVAKALQTQGSDVGFEVLGPISVDARWNEIGNQLMRAAWASPSQPDGVQLVIGERITECGNSVGYILGCTPAPGRPWVFVKRHSVLTDWAPQWVIWGHEFGHAAGLGHPDGANVDPSLPHRLMTYAPTPSSTQLEANEAQTFERLGQADITPAAPQGGASAAVAPDRALQFVAKGGAHGVDLSALAHLNDAQLLPLQNLLRADFTLGGLAQTVGVAQSDVPALRELTLAYLAIDEPPSLLAQAQVTREAGERNWFRLGLDWFKALRATKEALPAEWIAALQGNAVSVMAELGGQQTESAVQNALSRRDRPLALEAKHLGLLALGRKLERSRSPELAAFLGHASVPQFWCPDEAKPSAACLALAATGQRALKIGGALPRIKAR